MEIIGGVVGSTASCSKCLISPPPASQAARFLAAIKRKYEGSRLGRQELNAEILEDIEGALWKRSLIDELRIEEKQLPPLECIVVAIYPSASSAEDANECGIICAGLGSDGHAYVLDDISGVMQPHEWAREAVSLLNMRRGDRIITEVNNGGAMVEDVVRMIDPRVPFRAVWASRGKVTRAEPVSALYEQGRVRHVGPFPRLEDQMCAFTTDFDRREMGYSPRSRRCVGVGADRADDRQAVGAASAIRLTAGREALTKIELAECRFAE
jgi:predicted phage terminase large subunit-like protein